MMPLFDMMREAQNGEAMRQMARQFGLNERQMEDAVAALAPAFSTALKRNAAAGPEPMGEFLKALSGGHHQRYFEDMQAAFSPQGVQEGNGILGHMFGSKDLSRQVAAQAAQATGIGEQIFRQMLPVMASMIMGGLFKQMTTPPTRAALTSGNVFADIMGEMMRQGSASKTEPQASKSGNPFVDMMETMFGGASGKRPPDQPAQPSMADNPFGRMFEQMMGGPSADRARADPTPEPDTMPSGRRRNPYDDLFGPMFDSGREIQAGYQKSMDSIFDQYLEGMKRHR